MSNPGKSKRILILGNPNSPLTRERSLVGRHGGHTIYWYSEPRANIKDVAKAFSPPTLHLKRLTKIRFLVRFLHLKQTIKTVQPDLIHVHGAIQYAWDNLILLHFRPVITTVMGSDIIFELDFHNFTTRFLVKKLLNHSDIITSKSQFLDFTLNQIGDYASKIRRVTWGVDIHKFKPGLDTQRLRLYWKIPSDAFVFFSPRICQPFYNQHIIIKAFANYLSCSNKKSILLIAEFYKNNVYNEQLKKLVSELKLAEWVRFVGTILPEEMPFYLNLADAIVSIPISDGMPQTLYEAMACQTYPILGDLPAYQEIVQSGVNGYMVPVGETEALADVMAWVTKHPAHIQIAGEFNRNYISKFADKTVQSRLVNNIYAELFTHYNL